MHLNHPINRRRFLVSSIAALSALGGLAGILSAPFIHAPDTFIRRIDPKFYDVALGKTYAENVLKGFDTHRLFERLRSKFSMTDQLFSAIAFPSVLRSAIEKDYRHGRVIEANGWVMAETAVYLSALAYLVQSDVH